MPIRNRRAQRTQKHSSKYSSTLKKAFLILFSLVILTIVLGMLIWSRLPSVWDGNNPFVTITKSADNGINIFVLDPSSSQISKVLIPQNTLLDSRMGEWKAGNLWQLGEDEKTPGSFVAFSVMKTMKIPVDAWGYENSEKLFNQNIFKLINGIFSMEKSSLHLKDKVNIALFSLKHGKNLYTYEAYKLGIVFEDENFDEEAVLRVRDSLPSKFISMFSKQDLVNENKGITIINATGGSVTPLVGVIETVGSKVTKIENLEESSGIDCIVTGSDEKLVGVYSNLFKCSSNIDANFEIIQIELGALFKLKF